MVPSVYEGRLISPAVLHTSKKSMCNGLFVCCPACVLEELEQLIKEVILEERQSLKHVFEDIPEDTTSFDVDLADFFDVISGIYLLM